MLSLLVRGNFFYSAMGRLIDCRNVPSWVCTQSKPYKDPNSKIGYHLYTTRFYSGGEGQQKIADCSILSKRNLFSQDYCKNPISLFGDLSSIFVRINFFVYEFDWIFMEGLYPVSTVKHMICCDCENSYQIKFVVAIFLNCLFPASENKLGSTTTTPKRLFSKMNERRKSRRKTSLCDGGWYSAENR